MVVWLIYSVELNLRWFDSKKMIPEKNFQSFSLNEIGNCGNLHPRKI